MYTKHVHIYYLDFVFIQFTEPFTVFQPNSEIATAAVFCDIFFNFSDLGVQAVEEGFSPDASFWNTEMGRKRHFYHHFSEQGRSPCKTVSCRGAGQTQKGNRKNTLRDQIG